MKNVLHLIDTTGAGGAESVFLQLVGGLDKARFRSTAVLLGRGWVHDQLVALGVEPIIIPSTRSADLPFLRSLVGTIRSRDIDLLQTHLLTTSVYGSVAGRLAGVPTVATFHGLVDVDAPFVRVKARALEWGASKIVFVSDSLRKAILARTGVAARKAMVIHNGVDTVRFAPRRNTEFRLAHGIAVTDFLVGGVGRLIREKGFDVLIRAAALLRDHPARFRFLIAGAEGIPGGSVLAELSALRDELGLGDRVVFVGFQPDSAQVFNALDLFALTSRTEGFSLTTIEAMASGLPSVVTRSGGPQEIVTPDVDAVMIASDDPVALANALSGLADSAARLSSLASAARETVLRRFSLESTLREYEELYAAL